MDTQDCFSLLNGSGGKRIRGFLVFVHLLLNTRVPPARFEGHRGGDAQRGIRRAGSNMMDADNNLGGGHRGPLHPVTTHDFVCLMSQPAYRIEKCVCGF